MIKQITKDRKSLLKELFKTIKKYKKMEKDVEKKCAQILGLKEEDDNYDYFFDYLFNDYGSVEEMLKKFEVKVKEAK